MLQYFTAGKTHGKRLITIVEVMPAGVEFSLINKFYSKRTSTGKWQRQKNVYLS